MPIDLKSICVHIKNGIDLFYVKVKTENGNKKITELIIEDKSYINQKNCVFSIVFSISLLEKFFLQFSKAIINNFDQAEN